MNDQRNLFLAIGISIAIIVGFQFIFPPPEPTPGTEAGQPQVAGQPVPGLVPGLDASGLPQPPVSGAGQGGTGDTLRPAAPQASGSTDLPLARGAAGADLNRERRLSGTARVRIETPRLHGSIALTGGALDDLTLIDYRTEVDPDSPEVTLLSPGTDAGAYWASFGWVPSGGTQPALPGKNTLWQADKTTLAPGQPVTLSWDNGQGLRFTRRYEIDDDYMFTVTQKVENRGDKELTLFPYALVLRYGTPPTTEFSILHEGPLGVFRQDPDKPAKFDDYTYDEVVDAPEDQRLGVTAINAESTGGWIGFGDHFWLVALVPDPTERVTARFSYKEEGVKYQVDYLGEARTLAPGGTIEASGRLFAGAKELSLLEDYEEQLGIEQLNLAIDFGWFYFLAKPIFKLLVIFNGWIGNFGVAILFLTLSIKILFFPLANKSYRAMGKMKKLQPEMIKLRERYKDDKQRLNQEMMGLYKKEKVNPAAGCLPMIVQIPVFIALYQLLFATIEMRHAPFFWWIQDLSSPDPTNFVNLFGLLPFSPVGFVPDFLLIGIWPLIMGVSMFLQQKLNPTPPDPIQAKIFMFLPIIFTFMLARFPAGLVIYWAWNNVLSIAQQWIIMKRAGAFATKAPQAKT